MLRCEESGLAWEGSSALGSGVVSVGETSNRHDLAVLSVADLRKVCKIYYRTPVFFCLTSYFSIVYHAREQM